MKITKLGHCCLLIEEQGVRLLTDPGAWTSAQNELKGINIVLITHEHADHFHLESVREIMGHNPEVTIITNRGVGKLLDQEEIPYQLLEDGQTLEHTGVTLQGSGSQHAAIYPSVPEVINTGYAIAGRLWYPGDALHVPPFAVECLALPVVGPWIKLAEALDYAKAVKPKLCFPVHDGMLKITGPFHAIPEKELATAKIVFRPLLAGDTLEV